MTAGRVAPARTLAGAVRGLSADLHLLADDRAALTLALRYAEEIDSGGDVAKLGPPLLATLAALGATPAARAAIVKGGPPRAATPVSRIDQLRAEWDARQA
jgi:hypothetical protein